MVYLSFDLCYEVIANLLVLLEVFTLIVNAMLLRESIPRSHVCELIFLCLILERRENTLLIGGIGLRRSDCPRI